MDGWMDRIDRMEWNGTTSIFLIDTPTGAEFSIFRHLLASTGILKVPPKSKKDLTGDRQIGYTV
jgi:hypothetical protein